MPGELLADEALLVGGAGDQRAFAVEQHYRGAGLLRGARRQVADPLQVNHREHDPFDRAVVVDDGEGGDQAWHLIEPIDQIIAEREFARMQSILKVRTI